MIPEFQNLCEAETELMLQVPALVTVLIAGADGEIDKQEKKQAISISKIRQTNAREALIGFYQLVGEQFEDDLAKLVRELPHDTAKRNAEIIEKLSELNQILPKLDSVFASKFYASIRDIAKKVAEASGGVLGYMSVGYEESKLIGLSMIRQPS